MAKHFNGDRSGRDALIALRDHFQDLDDRMTKLRDESNYGVTAADDLCNRQHIINRVAVDAKTRTLGFGPFRSNCITDLESTGTAKLWNTIMQFQKSILPAGKRALKEAKLGWRSVWPHSNFTYEEDINQCRLAHAVSYRVNGTWSVLGSVTDSPPNIRKENFQRRYIEEYLMPGKEARARVGNLKINLPEIRNENVIVTDSTTSMSTWGGMPASSIFSEVAPLERNPGIAAALARGRRWFQQAEDSRAVSNIAIMVLPACLSLVPIAVFADVSTFVTILYIIGTDFMACLPLFIKGIELIELSGKTQTATKSWIYGMETDTDISIAETWAAQCRGRKSLLVLGAVFSSAAAVAMLTGVALELVAHRKLKRGKAGKLEADIVARRSGPQQMWAKEPVCEECPCNERSERTYSEYLANINRTLQPRAPHTSNPDRARLV